MVSPTEAPENAVFTKYVVTTSSLSEPAPPPPPAEAREVWTEVGAESRLVIYDYKNKKTRW
jgi:hypothetical protein